MEIFKEVLYRDVLFTVSNYGKVKRLNSDENKTTFRNSSGYESFTFYNKIMLVHRIVATAFLDKPDGKNYVNHIDGNKMNNHVSNLQWVTRSENEMHSIHVLGNKRNIDGLKSTWVDSPNKKGIAVYDSNDNLINTFESQRKLCKHYGYKESRVSAWVNGINKSPDNFILKRI